MKKKSSRIRQAHGGGSRFHQCLLAYRLEVCISAWLELKCRVCGNKSIEMVCFAGAGVRLKYDLWFSMFGFFLYLHGDLK